MCAFQGNKGGVGVSMQINEASICFVNSHLAAHTSEINRRKEDHDEIVSRMHFGNARRSINDHEYVILHWPISKPILFSVHFYLPHYSHIFWIGDLNYRLTDSLSRDIFNVEDFANILKYDQLVMEMQSKRVFCGYTEGEITFRPTYKYDPGTDNWDSR